MKNLLIILVTFIGILFLNSCSKKKETKTVSNLFQIENIEEIVETKIDTVKFITVENKIWLSTLAKQYLNNENRHMEIAMYNYSIYKNPKRWHTSGLNPSWDYAYAKNGDKIYLPADAIGLNIQTGYESHTYIKEGIDIMDYAIDDLEIYEGSRTVSKTTQSNNTGWSWLSGFWNFLGPIFGMIILIALAILIIWLLYKLLRHLFLLDFNNRNENNCCDEIRNDITNLGNRMDQQHSQQMQAMETSSGSNYSPVEVINAVNNGGGDNQGYSRLKFHDKDRNLKISYINEKNASPYQRKFAVIQVLREKGGRGSSIDAIAEKIVKKFDSDEKYNQFLQKLSTTDRNDIKKFLKDELE